MKKIICIFLTILLCAAFFSCEKKQPQSPFDGEGVETPPVYLAI